MTQDAHEVIVHLVSETAYDLLKLLIAFAILDRLPKWLKQKVVLEIIIKLMLIVLFVYWASQSRKGHGFDNGVLFAMDCLLLVLLVCASAYPYLKKSSLLQRKSVAGAKNSQDWITNSTPGDKADVTSTSKGLRFGAQFTDIKEKIAANKQPSANVEICFEKPQDLRCWMGISFDIKCDHVYPDSEIKLQMITSEGSGYITGNTGRPVKPETQTAVLLFRETTRETWTPESSFGYLNLKDITKIAVVLWTSCDSVEYVISNFALLRHSNSAS